MKVPEWLKSTEIAAKFRIDRDRWQPVTILLNEQRGTYKTPTGDEEGTFSIIADGNHPHGGEVLVLHWLEKKGPFVGNTGIDTLWFQQKERQIEVRGTFFVDCGNEYGEIKN